jgi:hypothetical protein
LKKSKRAPLVSGSLDRLSLRQGQSGRGKVRLRWQAERPGALWHADVCHGAAIMVAGKSQPVRIRGILDDAGRYILAIAAHHTEREVEMLGLMVSAVRKHGAPDALYLDNGSTYRAGKRSVSPAPAWARRSSTPSPTTMSAYERAAALLAALDRYRLLLHGPRGPDPCGALLDLDDIF